MLLKTPESLKGKKYPKFIKEHLIFKAYQEVDKVFPKIGLDNCKVDTKTVLYHYDGMPAALAQVKQLKQRISNRLISLRQCSTNYNEWLYNGNANNVIHSDVWRAARSSAIAILASLNRDMAADPKSFIKRTKSTTKFILPKLYEHGTLSLRKGQQIVGEMRRLHDATRMTSHGYTLPDLSIRDVQASVPIPARSKIVFSSTGKNGFWDMATMSMRGITSCQHWGNDHAYGLIGSMIDPYAGVVYIERGKVKLGSKMLRRAVVRLVINKKSRKPALLVERVYPRTLPEEEKVATFHLFASFMKQKTKSKLDVVYGDSTGIANRYFIPLSEPVASLPDNGDYDVVSYRDSGVKYKELPRDISKYIS